MIFGIKIDDIFALIYYLALFMGVVALIEWFEK